MSSSQSSVPSLSTIPTEVVHRICPNLDPISLAALSQTCSRFRKIIPIAKQQLLEMLLALEILPENGGSKPYFRARDQMLKPAYTTEDWEYYRWACSSCLRLLSHIHFDNRSILQLRYRKPVAGSRAANIPSSWRPSLRGKTWGRTVSREPESKVDKQLRRLYSFAIHPDGVIDYPVRYPWTPKGLRDIGLVGFKGMTTEQFREMSDDIREILFDWNARLVEDVRCGSSRHTRKCNECRYQAGQLRVQLGDRRGSSMLPILVSRQVNFTSAHTRFFTDLPDYLGIPRPDHDLPISEISNMNGEYFIEPDGPFGRLWAMYMMRCPGCGLWQEMRAFRIGGHFPWWVPKLNIELWNGQHLTREYLDALRCNTCFAKDNGVLSLGKVLADFVHWLVWDNSRKFIESQLCWGWFALEREVPSLPMNQRKPAALFLKSMYDAAMRSWNGRNFSRVDVENIKVCHKDFIRLKGGISPDFNDIIRRLSRDFWFNVWMHQFNELEAEWLWMTEYIDRVQDNPLVLAEWALARNGADFL